MQSHAGYLPLQDDISSVAYWYSDNLDDEYYKEDIYVGYRYFNTFRKRAIAYPFGHGLSYTSFRFGKMSVENTEKGWNVRVKVTNTGKTAGKEVVQIYVKAPRRGLDKPERELKGFAKTPLLAPGETCEVEIYVSKESLASYDEAAKSWRIEKGRYTFIAGKNSLDNSRRKRISVRLMPR